MIAKYDSKLDREYFKKVIYAFNLHSDSDEMEEPNIEDVHKSYIYARKDFNEKIMNKPQIIIANKMSNNLDMTTKIRTAQ